VSRPVHHSDFDGIVHHRHDRQGFERSHHLAGYPDNDGRPGPDASGPDAGWQPGEPLPELGPCRAPCFADTRYYDIDRFGRYVAPAIPTLGDAASLGVIVTDTYGEDWDDFGAGGGYSVAGVDSHTYDIGTSSGATAYPHGARPEWSTCRSLTFTYARARVRERWTRYTVGPVPAGVAGLRVAVEVWVPNAHTGGHSVVARVATSEPTGFGHGTGVGAYVVPGVGNHTMTFDIPAALIPAEGGEFWLGLTPGEHAQKGVYSCGFSWPFQNGKYGSYRVQSESYSGYDWHWLMWPATPQDFGSGLLYPVDAAWFLGGLPWLVAHGGAQVSVDNVFRIASPDAGASVTVMTMPGAAAVEQAEEDERDLGEPWAEELGVRIGMQFRVLTLGDAGVAGDRYVRLGWEDKVERHEATVHLGSPSEPMALEVRSGEATGETPVTVTAGAWQWVWLDTRHPDEARAKLWDIADGEPLLHTLRVVRSSDADGSGNRLYVEAALGDGTGSQVLEIARIGVWGPAGHLQWVTEWLGFGDGVTVDAIAAHPVLRHSSQLLVDGFDVDTLVVGPREGRIRPVEPMAADDDAQVWIRYICDREVGTNDLPEEAGGEVVEL
jgi:hypothetical protein